jgi:hypothetical protein
VLHSHRYIEVLNSLRHSFCDAPAGVRHRSRYHSESVAASQPENYSRYLHVSQYQVRATASLADCANQVCRAAAWHLRQCRFKHELLHLHDRRNLYCMAGKQSEIELQPACALLVTEAPVILRGNWPVHRFCAQMRAQDDNKALGKNRPLQAPTLQSSLSACMG